VVEVSTGREIDGITGFIDEFSPDGAQALVIPVIDGADGSRRSDPSHSELWDLRTGRQRCTLTAEELSGFDAHATTNFSPDGSRLASTRAGTADVYDTATCAVVGTLEPDGGAIISVSYSPDGTRIVAAKSNGDVQTWPAP
jgi:WD40 repeat protein